MKNYQFIGVVAGLLSLWAYATFSDVKDEVVQQATYCENVQLWERDIHLPPLERAGHPDYGSRCE